MLPKKNRVDTNEIDAIFKACSPAGQKGKVVVSPSLTFKYFKNDAKEVKISFIAPKNVARLAVKRNLLRRLGYNVLRGFIDQFPVDIVGVFVFKKYQDDASIIKNEIKNILSKIN
jgi:ribonuclease P protein component